MRIEVPRRRPPGIRLTPLIDVVFILLVFFMLASNFLDWRAFELALPAADATPDPEVTPIVVEVDKQAGLRLDGNGVAVDALIEGIEQLRAAEPGRPVVVRAGDTTPVRLTVRTLDRLHAGGITTVSLAASAP